MLFSQKTLATHIVGGEIYYDNLGSNNYKVTLKVYRDCSSSTNASFDNPANLMVFNGNGSFYSNISMFDPVISQVPNQINNPCITTPSLCVEEAIYTTTINLPPAISGYDLVYQRCCRNNTIINILQPGSVGSTYMEHIPGTNEVLVNSSPRFTKRPLKFICNGIPIEFDHSATDPDGDSLVYQLCDPFTGLDACCPILSNGVGGVGPYCPATPSSCPTIGMPPPYQLVPFVSPYSGAYPLSSNPAINIHPQTGFLNGIPNISGQWVVGVCVLEYRHGVLIGSHKRDFQFNVVQCTVTSSAAIASQTGNCFGYTVNFDNQSFSNAASSTTYSWNFGDNTTLADTSHLFEPTYTYPDTGRYLVELIVNEGTPCSDTIQLDFLIYPTLDPEFSFTYTNACINNNSFDFAGGGTYAPYATFQWNFGAAATPTSSSSLIQNNVAFTGPGPFPVTLTMNQAICSESYTDTIFVYPEPNAFFELGFVNGCQPQSVQFTDGSQASTDISYNWSFGDGIYSQLSDPVHVYQDTGLFDVTLTIITTSGCIDTSIIAIQDSIYIKPSPAAGFSATPVLTDIFNPVISITDLSINANSLFMSTGDGFEYDYCPDTHYYEEFGEFEITQIAVGINGCPDTFKTTIRIKPEHLFWIPNAFTPNGDYINNVFKPVMMGVEDYHFYIFDRWGELIFKTEDQDTGWDGTYKGNKCQQDTYIYLVEYFDSVGEEEKRKTGTVTLIR